MSLVKRRNSNIWMYDFWHKGKRYQGSTGKSNRSDALVVESQEKEKVGKDGAHGRKINHDAPDPGVYFLRSPHTHYVKIGCSSNMERRIASYRTVHSEKLEILAKIPCVRFEDAEKEIHAFLKRFRVKGEWYKIDHYEVEAAIGYWVTGHAVFADVRTITKKLKELESAPAGDYCLAHRMVGPCAECEGREVSS